MAITQQTLDALAAKLQALLGGLSDEPLNPLNGDNQTKNLEALKGEVTKIEFVVAEKPQQKLSEAEFDLLGIEASDCAKDKPAIAIVTTAIKNALAKIDAVQDLTNPQLKLKTGDNKIIFGGDVGAFLKQPEDRLKKAAEVVKCVTAAHLQEFQDFNAVVAVNTNNLSKYTNAKDKLNSDNFQSLGGNFDEVIESITQIEKALANLTPKNMAGIFNVANNGHAEAEAKKAFIAALKDNSNLGHILSSDAKAAKKVSEATIFQTTFDEAAGDLFDKIARYAEKDKNGELNLTPGIAKEIWEDTKAFFGMLVKCALIVPVVLEYAGVKGFLQSDRAKRIEALESVGSFAQMLKDTEAKNQITNDTAKNVISIR